MGNTVKLGKGLMWQLTQGKRENIEDLQSALDILSECCGGYNCCEEGIIMIDRTTRSKYLIFVNNGVIRIEPYT